MDTKMTRRSFVLATGMAAGALAFGRPRPARAQEAAKRLRLAAVGVGGMGGSDLGSIFATGKVDVVALCDIDLNNLNAAAAKHPGARTYRDWREMLDKEANAIDAVSVGTPDHTHAPVAMSALQLGKHVYCEKPLAHEMFEVRQLTLAAEKAGVATQMGIQIHSHAVYRDAVQIVRDGTIGKVREWHSWSAAAGSTPGQTRPEGEDPVPPHVAWDLWLGVAPARPYKADVYHPFHWRAWRDFGCGALGDFGCHIFDPVFCALGVRTPLSVLADSPGITAENWPVAQTIRYEFQGTDMTTDSTIQATWYDGGRKPPRHLAPLAEGQELPDSGSLLIGEKGALVIPHYSDAILLPSEAFKDYKRPGLPQLDHYGRWVEACLGGEKTTAGFNYAGPLTEAVQLGNIAARFSGTPLIWDSANFKVTNCAEANAALRRPYREGWNIEGLS